MTPIFNCDVALDMSGIYFCRNLVLPLKNCKLMVKYSINVYRNKRLIKTDLKLFTQDRDFYKRRVSTSQIEKGKKPKKLQSWRAYNRTYSDKQLLYYKCLGNTWRNKTAIFFYPIVGQVIGKFGQAIEGVINKSLVNRISVLNENDVRLYNISY